MVCFDCQKSLRVNDSDDYFKGATVVCAGDFQRRIKALGLKVAIPTSAPESADEQFLMCDDGTPLKWAMVA